jgi:hypothetical protein
VGSDVNHIFFNILPALRPGVRVHFHDVFYPFEYPEDWVLNGRSWSEAYVLRAFLQFNAAFEIELFPNYLVHFHEAFFKQHMPLCLKNPGWSICEAANAKGLSMSITVDRFMRSMARIEYLRS